jgi:hypothetical protein
MLVELVFLGAAALVLVSALMVLRVRELVHAAVWLAAMLMGVAGVFLTLGAEFLAVIQVLVYVGAVITLILFTVMLTTPEEPKTFLETLDLPPGVTIESIEDLQKAVPAFTGEGPYKDLDDTNPRRPQRVPSDLYGVGLADDEYGTKFTPRGKKEAK